MAMGYLILSLVLPPTLFGDVGYMAFLVVLSALYMVVMRKLIWTPAYIVFCAIVLVYILISFLHFNFEPGYAFDNQAILAQAAPLAVFLVMTPCCAIAAVNLFVPRIELRYLIVLIVVTVGISLTLRADENIFLEGKLYGALAPALFLQALFAYFVVFKVRNRWIGGALLVVSGILAGALTNSLIQMACLAIYATRSVRWPILAVGGAALATFTVVVLGGYDFAAAVFAVDGNSGVRFGLWSLAGPEFLLHSPFGHGFGNGYNVEAVRANPLLQHLYHGHESPLTVANHNAFLDVATRLGWPGFLTFLWLLVSSWPRNAQGNHRLYAGMLLASVIIVSFFNPTLQSARSSGFIAFALGYLLALGRTRFAAALPAPAMLPAAGRDPAPDGVGA